MIGKKVIHLEMTELQLISLRDSVDFRVNKDKNCPDDIHIMYDELKGLCDDLI